MPYLFVSVNHFNTNSPSLAVTGQYLRLYNSSDISAGLPLVLKSEGKREEVLKLLCDHNPSYLIRLFILQSTFYHIILFDSTTTF